MSRCNCYIEQCARDQPTYLPFWFMVQYWNFTWNFMRCIGKCQPVQSCNVWGAWRQIRTLEWKLAFHLDVKTISMFVVRVFKKHQNFDVFILCDVEWRNNNFGYQDANKTFESLCFQFVWFVAAWDNLISHPRHSVLLNVFRLDKPNN